MSFLRIFRRLFPKSRPCENNDDPRHLLGRRGEKAALNHLKHEGYHIRALNYQWVKKGEIDIIAQEKNVIAFVEVRTLSTEQHGDPLSTISPSKRRHLTRVAHHYLNRYKLHDMDWRFDFVSVIIGEDKIPRVELIRNAFPPESGGFRNRC